MIFSHSIINSSVKTHKGEITKVLRIFICPKCFNYRMVSRKTNAVCFHCGVELIESEITYSQYTSMTLEERDIYKEKLKRR